MFPLRDHNPSGRRPLVTYALILANVAVFLLTLPLQTDLAAINEFYAEWAMIPARLSAGDGYLTLLSSMFLHGGFLHIAFNMLFLWIFGDNLEDEFGRLGYLAFYLASGIAAGLLQWAAEPLSQVPVVGASGAIAGVMGGYLLLFPRAKVDVLLILIVYFRVFAIPAFLVLGLWFALQIFGGLNTPTEGGGVAYWAHVGGFVAGGALALPVWLRRGGPRFWRRTDGHPPHPGARYVRSSIPTVRRNR